MRCRGDVPSPWDLWLELNIDRFTDLMQATPDQPLLVYAATSPISRAGSHCAYHQGSVRLLCHRSAAVSMYMLRRRKASHCSSGGDGGWSHQSQPLSIHLYQ